MSIFAPTTPEKLRVEQLKEARMKLLEHAAAREFNAAMEQMLRERIARLESPSYCPPTTNEKS